MLRKRREFSTLTNFNNATNTVTATVAVKVDKVLLHFAYSIAVCYYKLNVLLAYSLSRSFV